jgi:hypothetical protein
MPKKLVGRLRSNSARSAAGNDDSLPTLRDRRRVIYERVEAVAGDFGLK